MTQALRMISIQRGFDPADFTLVCFGGAGGLHLCALAEALEMRRAVVPAHAAMFSALGMIMAHSGRVFSRSMTTALSRLQTDHFKASIQSMIEEAEQSFASSSGIELKHDWRADLRYEGQSKTLEVMLDRDLQVMQRAFEALHETRYGHRLKHDVELVRIRLRSEVTEAESPAVARLRQPLIDEAFERLNKKVAINTGEAATVDILALDSENRVDGPRTLTAPGTVIKLDTGWSAMRDQAGHIYLHRSSG